MTPKVRFAPSPTGFLHVGNVRIAILNYLFAQQNNGKFVLRIDDTDIERSTKESENLILEDLMWIGISWDEFYRQSEHLNQYDAAIEYLKKIGRVYPCYETKEELSLKKKIQSSMGLPPIYDRSALKLTTEEIASLAVSGLNPYWRFKLNDTKTIEWDDLVHGKISIALNSVSDPVVIKPDGSYVYTFASVVDDINIGITDIIRGDDHITNTSVQIDLFDALCGNHPRFAHIPLMSSIDSKDISKRNNSPLSIINMRESGINPQSIMNVLASIGTSNNVNHRDDIYALIKKFSLANMSLSSCKFNIDDVKLVTKKILSEKNFNDVQSDLDKLHLLDVSEKFWNLIRGNILTLEDCVFWNDILFKNINIIKEDEVFVTAMLQHLQEKSSFEEWIDGIKSSTRKKGKELFHPIRIVLTGLNNGPELKSLFDFMGYKNIKSRIENNLKTTS